MATDEVRRPARNRGRGGVFAAVIAVLVFVAAVVAWQQSRGSGGGRTAVRGTATADDASSDQSSVRMQPPAPADMDMQRVEVDLDGEQLVITFEAAAEAPAPAADDLTRLWFWRGWGAESATLQVGASDGDPEATVAPAVYACDQAGFCSEEVPEGVLRRQGRTTTITIPARYAAPLASQFVWSASTAAKTRFSSQSGWFDYLHGSTMSPDNAAAFPG